MKSARRGIRPLVAAAARGNSRRRRTAVWPHAGCDAQQQTVEYRRCFSSRTIAATNTATSRPLPRRQLPTSGFVELALDEKIEEERLEFYAAEDFYPVAMGEVFASRYQVVSKLGYGSASTVWLCHDLREGRYCILKVCTRTKEGSVVMQQAEAEIAASKHMQVASAASPELAKHPGRREVRTVEEYFVGESANGQHRCLVYSAQGMNFTDFRNMLAGGVFEKRMLQHSLQLLLIGLDYLHRCQVVHIDLSPNNILLGIDDPSIFAALEEGEMKLHIARKVLSDRTLYLSRPVPITNGDPVISDLGAARFGAESYTGDIMPWTYRAPEVILGMKWSNKVDIWSIGILIWDLFEDRRLFYAKNADGLPDEEHHLAEMVALMGPPPPEFLERAGEAGRKYWDAGGRWIAETPVPPLPYSFETRETRLEGEDKRLLLDMARSIFRWLPEERPAADELAYDEFLMQAYFASRREQGKTD